MTNFFLEVRQRVSAEDAARRYGLKFNSRGWCRCPFHGDQNPSMSFRQGRFRCWACNASGDSIDFTARLFGLEPLAAVERLNADFNLGLPIHRQPTPEECQTDRLRRELAEAHRAFEAWRIRTIDQLNAAYQIGHEALKHVTSLSDLTVQEVEAVRDMSRVEYLSDSLAYGTPEEQAQIYRDRGAIAKWTEKILRG